MKTAQLQQLVIIMPIESMDVDSKIEAIIPVQFESVKSLNQAILAVAQNRKSQLEALKAIEPDDTFMQQMEPYFSMSPEEIEQDPVALDMVNRCNSFFEPYNKLVYDERYNSFEGTFIDFNKIVNEVTLEITLPEVKTIDDWFFSRLECFKTVDD